MAPDPDEIPADFAAFIADLSQRTGVPLDVKEAWADAKQKLVVRDKEIDDDP